MPATGRQITVDGMTYSRIVDGRAREAWVTWDTLAMMQQLGAVPETMPAGTT
jgi:predicted ester cyclase